MKRILLLVAVAVCVSACSSTFTGNLTGGDARPGVVVEAYSRADLKARVSGLKSYFDEIDRCIALMEKGPVIDEHPECGPGRLATAKDAVDMILKEGIQPAAKTTTDAAGKFTISLPSEHYYLRIKGDSDAPQLISLRGRSKDLVIKGDGVRGDIRALRAEILTD